MSLVFPRHKLKKQCGAALILALLVVVIVVLLASSLSNDFLVTFRRIENQLHGQQAYAYLRGAEGIARQVLQQDYETNTKKDHISEGWLNRQQTFSTDQGVLVGTVCDLQGRFNLNNLSGGTPPNYTASQERFIRLLQVLPVDPPVDLQRAQVITESISEWLDDNDTVDWLNGVETGYYSGLDQPYRSANRAFTHISELRWINEVDDVLYRVLEPYVVVLDASVGLNINTAPAQIISAINSKGDLSFYSGAESFVESRDGDPVGTGSGYDTVSNFITDLSLTPAPDTDKLVVESEYFLLETETVFLERPFKLYSVLYRNNSSGDIDVIARGKSGFGRCGVIEST